MKNAELADSRLYQLIERIHGCRIAVLGDFFLEKYLVVNPALMETSVETGKPAHQVVGTRCSPCAAGTVVSNLAALGAHQLHAIGLTGDDGEAFELRRGLQAVDCTTDHLISSPSYRTPTYLKPRDTALTGLAGEHGRFDTKNREAMSPALQDMIVDALDARLPEIDAVIVLDQVDEVEGGVVSTTIRNAVIEQAQCNPQVIFWVDSRCRIHEFRRMIVKSNQYEVMGLRQSPPGTIVDLDRVLDAAQRLRVVNDAPIAVTCGETGVLVSDPEWMWVPGVRVKGEIDATGAGDSFNAGAVLALSAGASFAEAAVIGNLVASITVQQIARTGVARPDQLPARLRLWNQQQKESQNG